MKHTTNRLFSTIVMITIAAMLTGCFAGAEPQYTTEKMQTALTVQQTLAGLRSAIQGAPNTWIYQKPGTDFYVFGWSINNGARYAFSLIDSSGKVLKDLRDVCAIRCDFLTASNFLTFLEENGWRWLPATALPKALSLDILTVAIFGGLTSTTLMALSFSTVPETIDPIEMFFPGIDT